MSQLLVIDIETAPDTAWLDREDVHQAWFDSLRPPASVTTAPVLRTEPPGNWKDPKKIAQWHADQQAAHERACRDHEGKVEDWYAEQARERRAKAALSPMDGRIRAIGWSLVTEHEPEVVHVAAGEDEVAVLRQFFAWLNHVDIRCRVGGWNIRRFDLPFINAKCAQHELSSVPWWPSPTDRRLVVDGTDYLTGHRLAEWLMRFGLDPKTGDGADAPEMSLDELRKYCANDVRVERDLLCALARGVPEILR